MIASIILMVLTLVVMFIGLLNPISTIPVMIFWAALGIMTEIRRTKPANVTVNVPEGAKVTQQTTDEILSIHPETHPTDKDIHNPLGIG